MISNGTLTTASNRLAGQLPLGLILQLEVVLRSALRQGGNNMSGVHSMKCAIIQTIMGLPQRAVGISPCKPLTPGVVQKIEIAEIKCYDE